jgi:plastocyanin
MTTSRRKLLRSSGVALTTIGLAGCSASTDDDQEDDDEDDPSSEESSTGTPELAVAAELNVYRARARDALALGRGNDTDAGAQIVQRTFSAFENAGGEYGAHEVLEETDHDAYEAFEEALGELRTEGLEADDLGRAGEEADIVDEELFGVQQSLVGEQAAHALDLQALGATLQDARVLGELGSFEAAGTVAQNAFARFETAESHEAIEDADHDTYEAFEDAMSGVTDAADAEDVETIRSEADAALQAALDGSYAVADREAAAGAGHLAALQARGYDAALLAEAEASDAAAAVLQDAFEQFETARVHELLEEADHDAYEAFEGALEEYSDAVDSDEGVRDAAAAFAAATLRAQFAVAGAVDAAPVEESEGGHDEEFSGGPNVVEGVPEDADHVVDMNAVSFDADELTVEQGDTVAWSHADGDHHSVTALEDEIPDDADYWASGGFDSEQAAREGWENGEGAVQSGQSFVHTFETTGTHEYVCIPHEPADMTGSITVE